MLGMPRLHTLLKVAICVCARWPEVRHVLSQRATLQAAVPRTIGPLYPLSCGKLRGPGCAGKPLNESGAPPDASGDASYQDPNGTLA